MTLSDFLPYVLPHATECSDLAAEQATRLALIEFCSESFIWSETQSAINSVAGQSAYSYTPATGQQVVRLEAVTVDGVDITVYAPGEAVRMGGMAGATAVGRLGGFVLDPAPGASGLLIVTTCAVAPSISADEVPDAFGRFVEQIGRGAVHRLRSTRGRAYSYASAVDAEASRLQWLGDIADARSMKANGMADVPLRTVPRLF